MDEFKFGLGDTLRINVSGENGEVIGRAQYVNSDPSYLIRYKTGDGVAVENWWSEGALSSQ